MKYKYIEAESEVQGQPETLSKKKKTNPYFLNNLFYTFSYLIWMWVCVANAHVAKAQLAGAHSLFPPCGFWELISEQQLAASSLLC